MRHIVTLFLGMVLGIALATVIGPALAELGTCYEYFGTTSCNSIGGPGRTFTDTGLGSKTYQDTDGGSGTIYDYGRGTQSYSFSPGRRGPC